MHIAWLILKMGLALLAAAFSVVAAVIGWIFLNIAILEPLKYTWLRVQAAAWNQDNWEDGTAVIVTVQVASDEALGAQTAVATINCYQKRFVRPANLKGSSASLTLSMSDGPSVLSLPFGPDATHVTTLRDACREVLREGDTWELPHVTESHYYWSYIVSNDQSFTCGLGNDPRTTKGEITRPTFVHLERLPLREILSAEAYASLPYPSNERVVPSPQLYGWRADQVETKCWRAKLRGECATEVEAICGARLR